MYPDRASRSLTQTSEKSFRRLIACRESCYPNQAAALNRTVLVLSYCDLPVLDVPELAAQPCTCRYAGSGQHDIHLEREAVAVSTPTAPSPRLLHF